MSSVRKLLEKMARFLGLPFTLSQLSTNDQFDHVVINNSLTILGSINQRTGTDFIDQPRRSARESVDHFDCFVREDVAVCPGIAQVAAQVLTYLGMVHGMNLALDIDSLSYGRVGLHLQLVPEFCLTHQNQSKGAHVCGKINLHTIAAQKYITPQAA